MGLGNSEGALHVLRRAASGEQPAFAGAVLIAPSGRSMRDVLLAQLAVQVPKGEAMLPLVEQTADRYSAREAMNPDPALPESVRRVLSSFDATANLPFARELWAESAADLLRDVRAPTLVLIGGKDVQIDQRADGAPLQEAASANDLVTFAFPPNANHVLKEDLRGPEEVAAAPGAGYPEPGTPLDPDGLASILGWLRRLVG